MNKVSISHVRNDAQDAWFLWWNGHGASSPEGAPQRPQSISCSLAARLLSVRRLVTDNSYDSYDNYDSYWCDCHACHDSHDNYIDLMTATTVMTVGPVNVRRPATAMAAITSLTCHTSDMKHTCIWLYMHHVTIQSSRHLVISDSTSWRVQRSTAPHTTSCASDEHKSWQHPKVFPGGPPP